MQHLLHKFCNNEQEAHISLADISEWQATIQPALKITCIAHSSQYSLYFFGDGEHS
jgi:hypothetical protein